MEKTYEIDRKRLLAQWLLAMGAIAVLCFGPIKAGFVFWHKIYQGASSPDSPSILYGNKLVFIAYCMIIAAVCVLCFLIILVITKKLLLSPMLRCSRVRVSDQNIKFVSFSGQLLLEVSGTFTTTPCRAGIKIMWNDGEKSRSVLLDKDLFQKETFLGIETTFKEILRTGAKE